MLAYQLTEAQAQQLVGVWYDSASYFRPQQDVQDRWVILEIEAKCNQNPAVAWVANLPCIGEFQPKPTPPTLPLD